MLSKLQLSRARHGWARSVAARCSCARRGKAEVAAHEAKPVACDAVAVAHTVDDVELVRRILQRKNALAKVNDCEALSQMCVNPFNGKLLSTESRAYKLIAQLGFCRDANNPLRLVWNADTFMAACSKLMGGKTSSRRRTAPRSSAALAQAVQKLLGPFESHRAPAWQREVAQLLREPDVLTGTAAALQRRYDELTSGYTPAKFDTAPTDVVADGELTVDQTHVLQLALRGFSLHIGGSAGTGKTVLLKTLHRRLTALGLRVAMTATTGVAAVQLGGCTFHHAFRVPFTAADGSVMAGRRWDSNALRAVDVVIVDEVSLLDAYLLDVFDLEAKLARVQQAPFGGLQLITCGDFLQLASSSTMDALPAYRSESFRQLVHVKLVTPMRQRADDALFRLLSELRVGRFNADVFRALNRPLTEADEDITYIFPCRREVQALNEARLGELQTPELVCVSRRGPLYLRGQFTFPALVTFDQSRDAADLPPQRGAVVAAMAVAVREVCPGMGAVAEHDCVCMPARTATPSYVLRLRLSERPAAIAVTASQWSKAAALVAERVGGRVDMMNAAQEPTRLVPLATLNALSGDMGDIDLTASLRLKLGCRVMVNRNLSRTVPNGCVGVVEAFMPPDTELFPRHHEFVARTMKRDVVVNRLFDKLPVVRLLNGEVVQIPPLPLTLGGGPQTYFYAQDLYTLPLQLGYAFTVHKVQGLTLHGTVVLDCKHFFACPHLIYVACSRVRSINQLVVRNVDAHMVLVKRSAIQFCDGLHDATDPRVLKPPSTKPRAAWTRRLGQTTDIVER